MIGPIELLLAFFLDLAIGDPPWLPHPVRIIGKAIEKAEQFLRRHFVTASEEKWGGYFLVIMIIVPTFLITFALHKAILWFSYHAIMVVGMALLVYLTATTIAVRELIRSAQLVIEAARDGSIEAARRKLSMIVGRDTAQLSEKDVLRATVETLAENLSDGVVAPLFYLSIGGLPLAMTYKAINTLDSMVGYKDQRYVFFGRAAARLDDLANYLPARITGLLIAAAAFMLGLFREGAKAVDLLRLALRVMFRDGRNHTSPNSGVPEASMAGALGVRLGGPSTYGGLVVEKPFIGESMTEEFLPAAERAIAIVQVASVMGVMMSALSLTVRALL